MKKPVSPSPILSSAVIDLDSPLPYYHQLKDWLHGQLASGQFEPDQQIPSEADLCQSFQVSRTVVRHCLDDLVNEGLLYRRKGKGTFVVKPKIREGLFQKLTGFYQDMRSRGFEPETEVLEQKRIRAQQAIAEQLGVEPGERLIRLVRLRSIQREPIVIVTTYLPESLCPGLLNEDLSRGSLYSLLEDKYHLEIARGRRTVEAVSATAQDAKLLGIKRGSPLVLLRGVVFLEGGRPLEYSEAKHRGDRSQFEVELVRVHEADVGSDRTDLPLSNGSSSGGSTALTRSFPTILSEAFTV